MIRKLSDDSSLVQSSSRFAHALGLAMALLATASASAADTPLPKLKLQVSPIQRDPKLGNSFAPIIKKAAPSVVNVYSTKTIKESELRNSPLFNDPLFRRFFGVPDEDEAPQGRRPRNRQEQSLGSGVIVSEDGYILTNNHVVDGADDIKIGLPNGDELPAKVIGADPATDSAVLKVDRKGLPAIEIANSDHLEVGDVVLAIGNPFGLGQTVTKGIISATGRGMGIIDYEDFIQTDASINPGNSGGALVDAEGRLIGINTAILSRTGGSQGVGFAVPINMARNVMERLVQYGKVSRGYLGVFLQQVSPDLAKEFNLPDQHGVIVTQVPKKTPASEAGMSAGDVIVELNGKKVTDVRTLRLSVSQTAPNTTVTIKAIRDGKPREFKIKLGELPADALASAEGRPEITPEPESDALDGVEVTDIDARTRRQFRIPANITGALVVNVDPDSTSATKLRPGDVILEINRQEVSSADEAVELSKKIKTKTSRLLLWRAGRGVYFETVENKPTPKDKR